jgi:predicted transcriptional regulator
MPRKPARWMQLPIDDRILEALYESQMILSPSVIAKNIDKSREEVSRRLSELVDRGLVDRVERGYYEITDAGEEYVEGELDLSDDSD